MKELNQLKLGLMSWRELSVWFGLKPDSLAKHGKSKEKKLQALAGLQIFIWMKEVELL